jgi:hypothetical protein
MEMTQQDGQQHHVAECAKAHDQRRLLGRNRDAFSQ